MRCKTSCCLLIALVAFMPIFSRARADVVEEERTGVWPMNTSTTINSGGKYCDGTINIQGAVTIVNYGEITSALNVIDESAMVGSDVYIENYGTFDAHATLGPLSTITQVINKSSGVTELSNIGTDYAVKITGMSEILSMDDIISKTSGATKYTFWDTTIQMNNVSTVNNVVLKGDVILHINSVPASNTVLFSNVSGNGILNIMSDNPDPMYLVDTYSSNGNVYVRAVRATDYGRILNNDVGRFLDYLRNISPDDALLSKMDSAENIDGLNDIMSKSIRINPINMMRSVKTLYMHRGLETMHIDENDGLNFSPLFVFSKDMHLIGGGPNLNLNISDDLHIRLFGNVFNMKYSDDINSYGGMLYGIGTDIVYDLPSDNFIRLYNGADYSMFDTGPVFDGGGVVENPNGFSGYVNGEVGHRFNFENTYYLSPFVMLGADYVKILNSDDVNSYIGAGADLGFNFVFDGFRYDYAMRGLARSDGGIGTELNIGIWSLADAAGVGLHGGMFYDDVIGVSYHFGLDARFDF